MRAKTMTVGEWKAAAMEGNRERRNAAKVVGGSPVPEQFTFGFELVRAVVEAVEPVKGAGTMAAVGNGVR